jgi:hypothetical protein
MFLRSLVVESCHRTDRKMTSEQETMSQRSLQQSGTDCLDSDGEQTAKQKLKRLKREPTIDLSTDVLIGDKAFHRKHPSGVPGCPNADWTLTEATLKEAIEQGYDGCGGCFPPGYHVLETDEETVAPAGESQ